MKVLLVEDEKKIADFVSEGLTQRGFVVERSHNGHRGLQLATESTYDAIVLDIMLPGRDGLSILKAIRKADIKTPVILLTARNELGDRVTGLELGADDYLSKPFFVEELAARIQALIRRATDSRPELLHVGDFVLNRISRKLSYQQQQVELTSREFSLLEYLMRSAGRVFTRSQILEHVWGYDFDPSTNVVDVCIKRLRLKLAALDPARDLGSCVSAVRGAGYQFHSK